MAADDLDDNSPTRRHRRAGARRSVAGATAVIAATALLVGSIGAGSEPSAAATPAESAYDANLALIHSASTRNANHDSSASRDTANDDLVIADNLGPRSDYLGAPDGNPESSFPVIEGGQFRTACEFSHFAYDDPLVKPGLPGASHLHMFWGNTDVNAHSTYDSLINSGGSTCNGGELNRTGYWAPAMFDASGNVRIPERIVIYYKGYGRARGDSQVYPPGAAMVTHQDIHQTSYFDGGTDGPGTDQFSYNCSNQWRGDKYPRGNTIPVCDGSRYFDETGQVGNPRATLEMHVKFPNCWNGEDPSNAHNWGLPQYGSWFGSGCAERAIVPNIEYIIAYPLEVGETTDGWFLASDIDPVTFEQNGPGGTATHADWWGGWQPEINQMFVDNCVNFATDAPSGCGFGYLTDGGPNALDPRPGPALAYRPQYTGPTAVSAATIFDDLCPSPGRVLGASREAAHCDPFGNSTTTTTTTTTTTSSTTTTSVPSTSTTSTPDTTVSTTVPSTIGPTTTVFSTTGPSTVVPTPTSTSTPTTSTPNLNPRPELSRATCAGLAPTIEGTSGDDHIVGTAGRDVIVAGSGNDVIVAGAGHDVVCGGPGDDVLDGGLGNDVMFGGTGDDEILGGGGADQCTVNRRSSAAAVCENEEYVTAANSMER